MSEITPEKVAEAVSEAVISGWRHRLQAALSVTAEGNVLSLETTRWGADDTETVRHFRAVVVEGETDPIVLSSTAQAVYVTTDLTGTLWLACAATGCREPLTVVEDGKTLGELAAPWAAHTCAEASQAVQNGGA